MQDGRNTSLNLSKVAGIFYILIGGMIASMLAALGEFLYRSRIEARKGNVNSLLSLKVSSTCNDSPTNIFLSNWIFQENLRGAFFAKSKKTDQNAEIFRKDTPVFEVLKKGNVGIRNS